MEILNIIDEDFINYKTPSMTIEFPFCSLKCDKESGESVCQNSSLLKQKTIWVDEETLARRYLDNHITNAIVCQGLEPFDSKLDLFRFIYVIRKIYKCDDTIVIYTGYNKEEIEHSISLLKRNYKNIIVKFGRFIPNSKKKYDEVLGVELASENQYGEKIS